MNGRRRRLTLVGGLLLAVACYMVVVTRFDLRPTPGETFFRSGGDRADHLHVYVEPLSVDVVNAAMQLRLYVQPGERLRGRRMDAADRDVVMLVLSGDAVEELAFPAHERMAPATVAVDLSEGGIDAYPLDFYRATVRIQVVEGRADDLGAARPIPVWFTVWQGITGFDVGAHEIVRREVGDLEFAFELRRPGAMRFFAVAAYGAMVVLAASSLTIASLIFLQRRRMEATLAGALGAIIFALPVLRNAMPGAPPLGVTADVLIFLWAELAAVAGLGLLVLSWALDGPPADRPPPPSSELGPG